MSFFDQLQPASLGGVNFGVLSATGKFGRRQAVHEYPFRETCWVEDMGKSARRISLIGFLVENDIVFNTGDVIAERDKLIGIAESPGLSTLVHPTLGTLTVSLMDLSVSEKWDEGRYFELAFSFIESGKRIFPSVTSDTKQQVESAADDADNASAHDLQDNLSLDSGQEIDVANQTAEPWLESSRRISGDATSVFGMSVGLPGLNGRFMGGGLSGFLSLTPLVSADITIIDIVATGSLAQSAIFVAGEALTIAITAGVIIDIAKAAQNLVASILEGTSDPMDGVRLLGSFADFPEGSTNIQVHLGRLFRRCAVVGQARASRNYQPYSSDDAVNVRNNVVALLDKEIDIAGDSGEDTTFTALRRLRQAVISDMNRKGGLLPEMKTFSFNSSIPASVIALMLYRDPSRETEIIYETNAPHPAFQPYSMRLLSS